jgi:hypothetical protein
MLSVANAIATPQGEHMFDAKQELGAWILFF